MLNPIKQIWRKRHYSRKMVDLTLGVLNKESFKFRRFSEIAPNVVLLGAQKCGTTSLAHHLSRHPDIHVTCPEKECAFYIFDEWAKDYWSSRGKTIRSREELVRHHMLMGYSGQKWLLDASTHYTIATRAVDYAIPEKMKGPVERLIYIARNPFARMISNYRHVEARVGCDFNSLVRKDGSLVQTSSYAYQLESYLRVFARKNVKLLVFEEFVKNPQGILDEVCEFLSLPRLPHQKVFEARNVSPKHDPVYFESSLFDSLKEGILDEARRFEELLGRPTGWDLTKETWCGPSADSPAS
jgi:hypothetical protein